jgi:hypothetical protein
VDRERIWAGLDICALAGLVTQCPNFETGGGDTTITNVITVVNDCTLTSSPGFSESQLVLNLCDNTLNVWVCPSGGSPCYWVTFCNCQISYGTSGSPGTGSAGGPCVPGVCTLCTNPPFIWTVYVSGMTGTLQVLNGVWTLFSQDNCRWSVQMTGIDGKTYYASFVVGVNNEVLGFANLTDNTVMAVYASRHGPHLRDCCQPVPLLLESSQGDQGTGVACTSCSPSGGTPISWLVTFTGLTGIFAVFNGTWTVPQTGACQWELDIDDANDVIVINAFGTSGTDAYLQLELNPAVGGLMRYFQSPNQLQNCCVQQQLALDVLSTVGEGTGPETCLLLPSCDTGEDGAPPELLIYPLCCPVTLPSGSGGSGGGGVVTSCCPGGVASTLYATFTGALAVLGRVPLVWTGTAWQNASAIAACCFSGFEIPAGAITFSCDAYGDFQSFRLSCNFCALFIIDGVHATTCSPFLWTASGTQNANPVNPPCAAGAFDVTIRDT